MKRRDSKGRPLNDRPAVAMAFVLLGYILTEALSGVTVRTMAPQRPLLGVLVELVWFSVFTFVFVPKVLGLPGGDRTIRGFMDSVGLGPTRGRGRLVVLALTCYAIFVVSQLLGALIYHAGQPDAWVLDPSRHGLFDTRSIIAGIFEDVILRGVIVTLLLRSFTERRAIVISAAAFAGLHLLNLLNPDSHFLWVVCQVAWAFGLGVMYAYMYVRTRSLLPLILLHYLINALVGVWFRGLDTRSVTSALYGVPFFEVVPAVLAMAWTAFLARRWGFEGPSSERPA